MRTARLILEDSASVWRLAAGASIVGRKHHCTVCLEVPSVSREHARIERKPHGWYLQDLGSANGTLLNGVPVAANARVRHGDRLQFGQLVLRFEADDGEEGRDASSIGETSGITILSRPETRPVTMLVADLEGYTAMSDVMESSDLADVMRHWCEDCRRILDEHGACLDKFIGDCVFAWWQCDSMEVRVRAMDAARAILEIPSPVGGEAFRCGAALNCGQVALCRLPNNSHTLLGSAVNATFRIEALTREMHQQLLVSEAFADGYPRGNAVFISCGSHQVKGIPLPITVLAPRWPELVSSSGTLKQVRDPMLKK